VGETLGEREAGQTEAVVERQLNEVFSPSLSPRVQIELSSATGPDRALRHGAGAAGSSRHRALQEGAILIDAARLIMAYEPVWAIGTGRNATPGQAQQVHAYIRSKLASIFGTPAAEEIRILYGGSVKPDNASDLAAQPDIDGMLVGGASLVAASFVAIIHAVAKLAGVKASRR
jgi:triosephosphate isomerase